MNDETTLLPCPFCGGEAEFQIFDSMCNVICENCHIGTRYESIESYEQVIAAWNARAERTCDYKQAAEYWQRMYEETMIERTCHDTDENDWHFVCSVCSYEQNGYEQWNYCPSCGAKVVDA